MSRLEETYIMGVDTTRRESISKASSWKEAEHQDVLEAKRLIGYHRANRQNPPKGDQRPCPIVRLTLKLSEYIS